LSYTAARASVPPVSPATLATPTSPAVPASAVHADRAESETQPHAAVATLATLASAPAVADPLVSSGEPAQSESSPPGGLTVPQKGKRRKRKIPKAERTARPGWIARLFFWAR